MGYVLICEQCKKEFVVAYKSETHRRFCSRQCVCAYRTKNKKKPNLSGGTKMERALTPDECARMRMFLMWMVAIAGKINKKITISDIAAFIKVWRGDDIGQQAPGQVLRAEPNRREVHEVL